MFMDEEWKNFQYIRWLRFYYLFIYFYGSGWIMNTAQKWKQDLQICETKRKDNKAFFTIILYKLVLNSVLSKMVLNLLQNSYQLWQLGRYCSFCLHHVKQQKVIATRNCSICRPQPILTGFKVLWYNFGVVI